MLLFCSAFEILVCAKFFRKQKQREKDTQRPMEVRAGHKTSTKRIGTKIGQGKKWENLLLPSGAGWRQVFVWRIHGHGMILLLMVWCFLY